MRTILVSTLLAAALPAQAGSYSTFGAGCPGSPFKGHVSPKIAATSWGNSSNAYPFGAYNMRYQQEIDRSEMPTVAQVWNLLALRADLTAPQATSTTISVKVLFGTTTYTSTTLTTQYAVNATGAQTKVFDGQMFLPGLPNGNSNLQQWDYVVRFPQPFVYIPLKTTENFLMEVVNSTQNAPRRFPDTFSGGSAGGARLFAGGTTSPSGSVQNSYNLVLLFGSTTPPALSNTGVPTLNQSFSVDLAQGLPASAAGLVLGASTTAWGPFTLPLDLTGAGAPGCNLLVSFDTLAALPTDATGAASAKLGVPNDPGLLGIDFHNQWFVLDKQANALGLSWSNGGSGKIGK